jgi:hypothetical protein
MISVEKEGERGMKRSSIPKSAVQYFFWVWPVLLSSIVFTLLSGCTVYQPVPTYVPAPSTFDRAWSAAVGAAQDEGVRITSEDRVRGVISGSRGEQDVTITVQTQADGNVRVEFGARGPRGSDTGLASRISRAYDRRMGR